MTAYPKPAVRHAWADTAAVSDITDPGDTYTSKGWQIGLKPPRQYVNWVLNYTFAAVRYFCQAGVPAWDVAETYAAGALVVSPNGYLMRSLQNNNINNIPEAGGSFGVWWGAPQVATAAAANDLTAANTSWVHTNFIPVTATFSAINGQIQNAQVPSSAVTQWQGALSIAGSQVVSAVARSNSLFLTSGSYATFNWTGQAGQPSWLFGSNDGSNVFVWNPANFSVNNSSLLAGLAPNASAVGNTIVARDSSGYVWGQYLNQASANSENPSIGQVMVTNGVDGFLRKAGLQYLAAQMIGLVQNSRGVAFNLGPIIIQVGSVSGVVTSGQPVDVNIAFPKPFVSTVFGVFVSTNRNVAGYGQAIDGSNFASNYSATGCTITIDSGGASWIAIGM